MTTTTKAKGKPVSKPKPTKQVDANPIWTKLLAERGPLHATVDTEYEVLASRAVLALAGRKQA